MPTSRRDRVAGGPGVVHLAHTRPGASPAVVASPSARIMCLLSSSNSSPAAPGAGRTRYAPPGSPAVASAAMARSRRRNLLRTTAEPCRRLIVYPKHGSEQDISVNRTPICPERARRPVLRSSSKVRRSRIRPGVRPGVATGGVRRTGDAGPSAGANAGRRGPHASTSACGNHGSWRACVRSVGTSVSQVHILPLPGPGRLAPRGRGPGTTGTRTHARRETPRDRVRAAPAPASREVYRCSPRRAPRQRGRTGRHPGPGEPKGPARRPSIPSYAQPVDSSVDPSAAISGGGPRERHRGLVDTVRRSVARASVRCQLAGVPGRHQPGGRPRRRTRAGRAELPHP